MVWSFGIDKVNSPLAVLIWKKVNGSLAVLKWQSEWAVLLKHCRICHLQVEQEVAVRTTETINEQEVAVRATEIINKQKVAVWTSETINEIAVNNMDHQQVASEQIVIVTRRLQQWKLRLLTYPFGVVVSDHVIKRGNYLMSPQKHWTVESLGAFIMLGESISAFFDWTVVTQGEGEVNHIYIKN